ncbi:hypothetical protein PUMCH_003192 [Australozyma saopauloensis]|uniref:Signal recognition particle subunit SRP72 n=1 Tax=Australozyma saopauloensis TaxID=291208 RepID=A0AAX4HBA7_9ASCO|nr:hypothetical protein PUMCH_003192 [[Candida] saopauloensis]
MSSSIILSFKSLNVATAQDFSDHEAIYQASYQYLAKVKEFRDIQAVHNVIVSLINTDRYYKALEFLKQVPEDILLEFPLEKAYIYYKTGHTGLVEEIYKGSITSSELSDTLKTAIKHVMAQCYYQNGKMAAALSLYHELITLSSTDLKLDIACNERAILSQMTNESVANETPLPVKESDKTYDFTFNEALIALRNNDIETSLRLLKQASSMCTEQNLDSDPADLSAELAPIELALAFVYQVSGQHAQALSTLKDLDLESVSDLLTKQIIKNNLISLTTAQQNMNYTARELNFKDILHLHRNKMTRAQFRSLVKNHILLEYQGKTLSKTSNYCSNSFLKKFAEEFDGDVFPSIMKLLLRLDISAEDLNDEGKYKSVSKKIYKFALAELANTQSSETLVSAALLLVFVNSKSSKFDQAIHILEQTTKLELESDSVNFHAAIYSALVTLYEATKAHNKLAALYASMIEKFEKLSAEDLSNERVYGFVRNVAFRLVSVDSQIDLSNIFRALRTAQPEDKSIQSIIDRENTLLNEEFAADDDVEDLLKANLDDLMSKVSQTRPSTRKNKITPFKITKKTQKPKFSKSKVLKAEGDFDAEKDLDQERWLPMKLRSYYKPSKKELKKKSGGHQGAVELSPAPSTNQSASSKNKQKKKKKGKK